MFRQLYNQVLHLAAHPRAELALFIVAFVESSFFPIPPDMMLIPMIIVNQKRAFRYAFICTAGSVIGGIFGYSIGLFAYDTIGKTAIAFYGLQESFNTLADWYSNFDVYIVAVAGFSPIPYKVFTLFSGFMQANFVGFVMASILSRGARFFLIAWLLWRGGVSLKGWVETNLYPLTMAASIVLIFTIVLVKYIAQ
tara:strand:- start:370601 stop:371185 length:585 start_codon:yes stop_codon:yes gene_type:complete